MSRGIKINEPITEVSIPTQAQGNICRHQSAMDYQGTGTAKDPWIIDTATTENEEGEPSKNTKEKQKYKRKTPNEQMKLLRKTHKEKQKKTIQENISTSSYHCAGCLSYKLVKGAFQVMTCTDCENFLKKEILKKGLKTITCNGEGAKHRTQDTQRLEQIRERKRQHCQKHRLLYLLAKGYNSPELEAFATEQAAETKAEEDLKNAMKQALYVGAQITAHKKFGNYKPQPATAMIAVAEDLKNTESCRDASQLLGCLAPKQGGSATPEATITAPKTQRSQATSTQNSPPLQNYFITATQRVRTGTTINNHQGWPNAPYNQQNNQPTTESQNSYQGWQNTSYYPQQGWSYTQGSQPTYQPVHSLQAWTNNHQTSYQPLSSYQNLWQEPPLNGNTATTFLQ